MKKISLCIIFVILVSKCFAVNMQKLRISQNNRFLVKQDGSPFVWIGDTNWFFAKLPPTTIERILDQRMNQGFTVMLVSCREKLYNGTGPGDILAPNEEWWSYLDEYIEKCKQRNLYTAITLGWWGKAKNHSKQQLYEYGKWVGNRYKDSNNVIWLTLGEAGSHSRKTSIPDGHIRALVNGIREGDSGNKLLTIHADYRRGTSITADGDICDFNNWQTSQWCCRDDLPRNDHRTWTVWEAIEYDYNKMYNKRPKPTLDSEAWYENNKDFCGATAFQIRRRAYFTILAGAFGHTYGAGGIWDGLSAEKKCSKSALEALEYPGANDIGHLSMLLHSLGGDYLKLKPNQSIILEGNSNNYDFHIQASVTSDKRNAFIYSASDFPYTIDLTDFPGNAILAKWFNPRNGKYQHSSDLHITLDNTPYEFDPPGEDGAGHDWLLVLKILDAKSNSRIPGRIRQIESIHHSIERGMTIDF